MGRGPKSSFDTMLVMSLKDIVDSIRQMTILDICNVTGHCYWTVQCVLIEELNLRKISAR